MAYGTNAPFGLRPISSILGVCWTEKTNEYYIYASNDGTDTYTDPIFTGDPVVWGTSIIASPSDNGGIGTIAIYNPNFVNQVDSIFSGVPILGVFVGCEYFSTITGTNNLIKSAYWPGGGSGGPAVIPGTQIKAYVIDDPEVLYDIQVSTHINANANAFVGNPIFPNLNPTATEYAGSFGSVFALNYGGGTNFNTVQINGVAAGYANNPAIGSTLTGQSAFYLDVDTSTAPGYNNHDYIKNNSLLNSANVLPLRALPYYTRNPNNIARVNPVQFGGTPTTLDQTPFLNVTVMINNHANAHGAVTPVIVD